MNPLDSLLLLSLFTAVVMSLFGHLRAIGWLGVALYAGQLVLAAGIDTPLESAVGFNVFGQPLGWTLGGLGWFFAVLTLGIALPTQWYAAGAWARQPDRDMRLEHGALAVNVLAILILLASGDLLSLFIGWELVSWATFLIMAQRGGAAMRASLRYILYATAGAMMVLAGIVLLFNQTGSFALDAVRAAVPQLSAGMLWVLFGLFAAGFGIKMAIVPFHLWQAEAYAETPGPGAAFLGAVSGRTGLFALALVLVQLIGVDRVASLLIPLTALDAGTLLAWVAAFTMVVPTFIALMQTDARLLLAWHGIGQGGYMLLGLAIGTPMAVSGGLLHAFNYATYQAALFLAVTAVVYRTGTAHLDRLGGLITRMPLSYVALLLGIIGLAGLPPMNGFVSKWLIYKALLEAGQPLLLVAAVIGTLGTILSVYKLIHNIFLGQLRAEHRDLREAPPSMTLPMLALAAVAFLTGVMPGLALDLVDVAQAQLGVAPLAHHLGGVRWPTGSLNMLWVVGVLFGAVGVGALIFWMGHRRTIVHQYDNYAGGHFLTSDVRYHYSHNFYPGVFRLIGPWYRGTIVWLEQGLASLVRVLGDSQLGLYRMANGTFAMLAFTVAALLWLVGI